MHAEEEELLLLQYRFKPGTVDYAAPARYRIQPESGEVTIRHPLKGTAAAAAAEAEDGEGEEQEEGSGENRKSLSFHGHRCVVEWIEFRWWSISFVSLWIGLWDHRERVEQHQTCRSTPLLSRSHIHAPHPSINIYSTTS